MKSSSPVVWTSSSNSMVTPTAGRLVMATPGPEFWVWVTVRLSWLSVQVVGPARKPWALQSSKKSISKLASVQM